MIDESETHKKKHIESRISTLRGIMIDSSDENENANDSIRFNREFDSKVIDESEVQFEKQCEPIISISAPIPTFDDFEKLQINL
jgi:hypothetical protein